MLITLLILINLARQTPLVLDEGLSNIAQIRAEQLYKEKQWSHEGWKSSFEGTNCKARGENLAKDFKSAKSIHKALMASPMHKANIMYEDFDTIELGRYKNITVQLFCDK